MSASRRPARIGFLLSQLGAHAADLFGEEVAPLGVTPSQAGVIRIVGRAPGISQRELAARLGTVQSRVVALLDTLEDAGLCERARRPDDRRVQEVRLTDRGRALLGELRRAAEAQEAELTEGLDAEERDRLYALLTRLAQLRELDEEVHAGTGRAGAEGEGAARG